MSFPAISPRPPRASWALDAAERRRNNARCEQVRASRCLAGPLPLLGETHTHTHTLIRPALRREPSREARDQEITLLGNRPRGAAGFVQTSLPPPHTHTQNVESRVCFPDPRAVGSSVTHADSSTRAGTHQSHTATSGGLTLCPGMLPGFPAAATLGRVISAVLRTQVGARRVTYQGLLPRGPHRERSEPRDCAPGSAWGLRPTLQPSSEAAPRVSPRQRAVGVCPSAPPQVPSLLRELL